MTTKLIISLDIGTTSTKAVLFQTNGFAVASYYAPYTLTKGSDGSATQAPDEIFAAVLSTLKQALDSHHAVRDKVIAITFASAMHSLIALDQEDRLLTPVITWADSRATLYAEKLKNSHLGADFYQKTGTPIHPMTPLAKIMWLQGEQPQLYQQIARFTSIKEYILFKLFGCHLIDYSLASGTGLFNIHSLTWDKDILAYLNISDTQLPKLFPPTHQLTDLKKEYRDSLTLPHQIPFIIGASDGPLANLGTNCLSPDKLNLTIGTSAALRLSTPAPLLHPTGDTFCYVLDEGTWVVGGAANNGGLIIDWARGALADPPLSYDQFMALVSQTPAGADNLFFHPYLSGERAPLWRGDIRGSFTGLSLTHSQGHLCRAVLEGICYNINDIYLSLTQLTKLPQQVLASGGFAQAAVWKQVVTDILNTPITFPETHESSALGAMILALKSLGIITTLAESSSLPVFSGRTQTLTSSPNKNQVAIYQQAFKKYAALTALTKKQTTILTGN